MRISCLSCSTSAKSSAVNGGVVWICSSINSISNNPSEPNNTFTWSVSVKWYSLYSGWYPVTQLCPNACVGARIVIWTEPSWKNCWYILGLAWRLFAFLICGTSLFLFICPLYVDSGFANLHCSNGFLILWGVLL